MTTSQDPHRTTDPSHPKLLFLCGWVGVLSCVTVVLANLIGVFVIDGDGLIADTISALAAGPYAIIMDVGLYAFALGIFAAATGLRRLRRGHWSWTTASWLLTAMAIMLIVIGAYGEYGDDDPGGLVIHFPLVVTMALTFAVSAVLTANGFREYDQRWFWFNIVCAVLWVTGSVIFWFSPTSIDGLVERAVAMVLVVWLFAISKLLIDRSKSKPLPFEAVIGGT